MTGKKDSQESKEKKRESVADSEKSGVGDRIRTTVEKMKKAITGKGRKSAQDSEPATEFPKLRTKRKRSEGVVEPSEKAAIQKAARSAAQASPVALRGQSGGETSASESAVLLPVPATILLSPPISPAQSDASSAGDMTTAQAVNNDLEPGGAAAEIPEAPAATKETDRELPSFYELTRLVLLVRDPQWLMAYWEIALSDRLKFGWGRTGKENELSLALRIYDMGVGEGRKLEGSVYFDVPVKPFVGSWYVHLPRPNRRWIAELGLLRKGGKFTPICRSNAVQTPRDSVVTAEEIEAISAIEQGRSSREEAILLVSGAQILGGTTEAGEKSLFSQDPIRKSPVLQVQSAGSSEQSLGHENQ